MAGYSARQSSFTTGDTITAAHSNDEFNQVLAAFHATTGHTHDGTAGEGGPIGTLRDADSNNKVLIDSTNNHLEFYVEVSSSATQQLRIQDGAIVPITDNDIDLGTSSLEFKDLYVDGTAYVDAINYNGTAIASTAAELNIVDGDTSATSTTVADADRVVLNDNGTMVQVAVTDLAAYFDDEITAMPNVTSVGTLTTLTVDDITINGSTISDSGDFTIDGGADIILDADGGDVFFKDGGTTFGSATNTSGNLIIKSGTTTALTFSGADVTVAGDLTVTGDDITMGTNTAGNILVADGTNFNSIAATSLSEISTIANDDVFLAVDTSGGGLKKVARSTVVSGLATSSAISNVVEDTSPQLGGDLDMNGADIVTTSNADLELAPNGTGHVTVKGNTNPGTIQFNCENNSHGQQLKPQPHSVGSSAVHTLPDITGDLIGGKIGGTNFTNSLLVGHATHGTLDDSNSNTGVGITALDALTSGDGNTAVGFAALTANAAGVSNVAIGSGALNSSNFDQFNTAVGTNAGSSVTSSDFNTLIGGKAGDSLTGNDSNYNLLLGYEAGENVTTGAGNVIIGSVDADSATGDRQLKICGYDGSTTTTWISGDNSGILTFADDIKIKDGGTIGNASVADVLTLASTGIVTFKDDILIKDGGTIGSASDADAITIASNGVVTFSQAPVFPDGVVPLVDLDIDGGTDINAALTTSDLIIVDDGAGGTNRKAALSRVVTLVSANIDDPTALAIALG